MSKFDSYTLHIEQKTLDKLNEVYGLLIKNTGKSRDFNYIIVKAMGYYATQIKYQNKRKNTV